MKVSEAVHARRAVKWYDPQQKMPEETFRQLMEDAILAPTAFNIQNWRFVRVTDAQQRKEIRAVAWDQAQVTDASELLVLCFDCKAWSQEPGRYWRNAPKEVQDFLVPAIAEYYRGKPKSGTAVPKRSGKSTRQISRPLAASSLTSTSSMPPT